MNSEHNQRQPQTIRWGAPQAASGSQPAWDGPSPDAPAGAPAPEYVTPAPQATQTRQQTESSSSESAEPFESATQQDSWGYRPQGWNDSASDARVDAAEPRPSTSANDAWGYPENDAADAHHGPSEHGVDDRREAGNWAGAASSGSTADEISHSHPDNSGFGWSDASGSSRFDAPDRNDHAPRRDQAYGLEAAPQGTFTDHAADERRGYDAPQSQRSPHGESAQPVARYDSTPPPAPASERDVQQHSAPASYASAPNIGQTGTDSYASAPSRSDAMSNPPQVVGQNDDLPDDSLTIGRSRSNSIVLDDMLVSRRHVVITADEEGLLLRDLGSRNGTFVNARRVEQTHLHEGDRIGIGASTFEVRDGWLVSV